MAFMDKLDFSNPIRVESDKNMPREFIPIKRAFEEAKEEGTEVLMETTDLKMMQSVVMTITYVGNRFATGRVKYSRGRFGDYVPYTVNYADVFINGYKSKDRIIFRGENPYEDDLKEVEV